MAGGRPRKPHRMRVLEGGRGKSRPMTPDRPAPKSPLVAPANLSAAEKRAWSEHVTYVRSLGTESRVDRGQFLAMVRFYCRALAADNVLARRGKKGGLTIETNSNGQVQRPEVAISERCWKFYAQLADKFGLSETARAKLGATETPPEGAGDVPPELRDASGG
jgi:P27 family predicted phage terminase small subunit